MTIKKNLLAAIVAASCVTSVVTAVPTQLAATAFAQTAASSVDVGAGITATIEGNTLTLAGNGTLDRDKFRNIITEKFAEGSALTTIKIGPASKINLPADSSYLFSLADSSQATSLTTIDGAQYLNTGAVTTMQGMFAETSIDPDVSTWDTSKVTNFSKMFQHNQVANPNVTAWNVRNATDFSYMFNNAKSARPNTATWVNGNYVNVSHMFDGCPTNMINITGLHFGSDTGSTEAAFHTGAETTLVSHQYDISALSIYQMVKFAGSNYTLYDAKGNAHNTNVENANFSWGEVYSNGVVSNKKPVLVSINSGSGKTGQAPKPAFTVAADGAEVLSREWVEGSLSTTATDNNSPGSYPITMGTLRLKPEKAAEYILVPINTASWEITGISATSSFIDFGEIDTTKPDMQAKGLQLCNTGAFPQNVTITAPKNFTVNTTSVSIDSNSCSGDSEITILPKAGLLNGDYTGDLVITPEQGSPVTVRLHAIAIGKAQDTKVAVTASPAFTAETEELTTGTLTAKVTGAPQDTVVKWYKYDESSYSSNWVDVEDAAGDKLPVKVTNIEQKYRVNVEKTQGGILATTDFTVPKGKAMQREVTLTPDAALSSTLEVGTSGVLTAKVTNPPASKLTYKWYVTEPNSYNNQEYTTEVPTLDANLSEDGDYTYTVQVVNELGTVIGENKLELSTATPPSLTVDSNPNNLDQYAATQQVKVTYAAGENGPEEVTYRWTVDGKAIDQTTDNALINRDKQAHEVKVEAVANGKVVASATTTVPARQVRKLTNVHVSQQTVDDKVIFTPEFNPVTYKVEPSTVKYTWTVGSKKYEGNQYSTLTLDKAALEGVTFVGFNADSDFLQASGSTTYSAGTTPTDNGSGAETPDPDEAELINIISGTNHDGEKTDSNSGSSTPGTTFIIALVVILAILGTIGAAINGAANNFGAALGNQAANNLFRR